MSKKVCFQGILGSNSHKASVEVFPKCQPLPLYSFEECFDSVAKGSSDYAMIPIENSLGGRVTDIHELLPASKLYIIGEHFLDIEYDLLSIEQTDIDQIKAAYSHVQCLSQCKKNLKALNITPKTFNDTAGAAKYVSQMNDKTLAAIANPLAAKLYNLKILKRRVEDDATNITRFIVLAKQKNTKFNENKQYITSLVIEARSVPAALYKCLGGFATNSVNLTKLESYINITQPGNAKFFIEVEGHENEKKVILALQELSLFAKSMRIIGSYPASNARNIEIN